MMKMNRMRGWISARFNSMSLAKCLRLITSSGKAPAVLLTAAVITIVSLALLAAAAPKIAAWIARIEILSYSVIYAAATLAILLFATGQLFAFLPRMWVECFVKVPPVQKGIVLRFSRRTGEIMDEGLGVKWPFIETAEFIGTELKRAELKIEFPSENNKEWLVVKVTFTYHPDLTIVNEAGRSVYVETSEQDLRKTVTEKISSKIAGISQFYTSEELLRLRPAITDYIRCWLRLKNMPHEHSMHAQDVLWHYTDERVAVKTALDDERKHPDEHSEIETSFGIDVEDFILPELDFTEETIKAKGLEAQVAARAETLIIREEHAEKLINIGVPPQIAVDQVNVALDPTIKPQIISIEGNVPALIVPANLFGGGKSADGGTDSATGTTKGRKGGKR